jgi:hypothetical protein
VSQTPSAPVRVARPVTIEQVRQRWPAVVEAVRPHSKLLGTLLADPKGFATPVAVEDGNVIVIRFTFPGHHRKMADVANRIAVEKAIRRVLAVDCKIKCVLENPSEAPGERSRPVTGQDDPVVAKARRMLDARMLTESELAAVQALPVLATAQQHDE